jgi:hypothetical protein
MKSRTSAFVTRLLSVVCLISVPLAYTVRASDVYCEGGCEGCGIAMGGCDWCFINESACLYDNEGCDFCWTCLGPCSS